MILTGGCLCGGVRWRAESAAPPPVVACHCEDCRRSTGNHVACATFDTKDVRIEETGLRLAAHEFVAGKADWDAIPPDGQPRFDSIAPGEASGR